jgi:sulfur-carrier protein
MAVNVRIPAALRPLVGGAAMLQCDPGTVRDLIAQIDGSHAGFSERITQDGSLRRFVNVFVSGEDVRFGEGIDTAVADGQEVTILPAVAGG